MNLLVFTSFGSMIGGANKALFAILDDLNKENDVEILVIVGSKGEFCDKLDSIGIPWNQYPFHKIAGVRSLSPRDLFRLCRFQLWKMKDAIIANRIINEIQGYKPDQVYINDITPYIGAMVAQKLCIPYTWHFRSIVFPNEHYVLGAKNLFSKSKSIIAISKSMQKMLAENPNFPQDKLQVVYDGVPHAENLIPSAQITNGLFHILQCGRITEDKGHIDALRAIGELKKRGINGILLHIVGKDPSKGKNGYFNELTRIIAAQDIHANVIFEGQIDDMPLFRSKMNFELMCSFAEPFGWVTVEGMRSGLVVFGSNSGATPEIVRDGITGFLYEKGNYIDLADKLQMLINDPNLVQSISKEARKYANSHFDVKENSSIVEAILKDTSTKYGE